MYVYQRRRKKSALFPHGAGGGQMGKKRLKREKEVLLVSILSRLSSFRKRSRSSAMNLLLIFRFRAQSGLSFFLLLAREIEKEKEVRRESCFLPLGEEREKKKKFTHSKAKQEEEEERWGKREASKRGRSSRRRRRRRRRKSLHSRNNFFNLRRGALLNK